MLHGYANGHGDRRGNDQEYPSEGPSAGSGDGIDHARARLLLRHDAFLRWSGGAAGGKVERLRRWWNGAAAAPLVERWKGGTVES
jgi:hypothetical protein